MASQRKQATEIRIRDGETGEFERFGVDVYNSPCKCGCHQSRPGKWTWTDCKGCECTAAWQKLYDEIEKRRPRSRAPSLVGKITKKQRDEVNAKLESWEPGVAPAVKQYLKPEKLEDNLHEWFAMKAEKFIRDPLTWIRYVANKHNHGEAVSFVRWFIDGMRGAFKKEQRDRNAAGMNKFYPHARVKKIDNDDPIGSINGKSPSCVSTRLRETRIGFSWEPGKITKDAYEKAMRWNLTTVYRRQRVGTTAGGWGGFSSEFPGFDPIFTDGPADWRDRMLADQATAKDVEAIILRIRTTPKFAKKFVLELIFVRGFSVSDAATFAKQNGLNVAERTAYDWDSEFRAAIMQALGDKFRFALAKEKTRKRKGSKPGTSATSKAA